MWTWTCVNSLFMHLKMKSYDLMKAQYKDYENQSLMLKLMSLDKSSS